MNSRLLDSPLQVHLGGMQLMEASAGTGKTWTLSSVYVLLILGHGLQGGRLANLLPRDILVVTFTNAAAAELRDRIRNRLDQAAMVLSTGCVPAGDSFLGDLLSVIPSREMRAALSWRLRKASDSMDEAAIHTIHGWCQHVLTSHAFDSGTGFHRTLETRKARWWRECMQDYWRTHVLPLPLEAVEVLGSWWSSPDELLNHARKLLSQHSDLSEPMTSLSDIFRPLIQDVIALREAFVAARETIETAWREAVETGLIHRGWRSGTAIESRWALLLEWSGKRYRGWPTLEHDFIEDIYWWGQSEWARMTTGKREPPRHPWFEMAEAFARRWKLVALRAEVLNHALAWMRHRLSVLKDWRGWMDFDDLVRDVHTACVGRSGAGLAAALASQYPVAMIDEFQDTDELQYGIFRSMYQARPDGMLMMIGDPKQAIYAFRGADIHTYLHAREDVAGNLSTLAVNHRSTAAVVSAVNAFFSRQDNTPAGPFMSAGIPFIKVRARGLNTRFFHEGRESPALTLWHVTGDGIKRREWHACMAAHCASRIASLLGGASFFVDTDGQQRPLTPSGIAVLVRSASDADAIAEQLSSRGVRSVYLSERGSVFAAPEARTVLGWLQAVANPADEQAARRALADPLSCQSLPELDQLQQDDVAWEAKSQQFRSWLQKWQRSGVMPMLRDFLRVHRVPSRLLATGPAGERHLTNILQLGEWLQEQSLLIEGERALIALFEEAIRQAELGDEGEENILRLESDEQRVRIITLHKSKGLEYDLVFMPFVADPMRMQDIPFRFHDGDGRWQSCWSNLRFEDGESAWQKAMLEQLAEETRLLYVGMTRARFACWIGVAAVAPKSVNSTHAAHGDAAITKNALLYHPLAWLLAGQYSLDGNALARALESLQQECADIQVCLLESGTPVPVMRMTGMTAVPATQVLKATRRLLTTWNIGSFSSWAHGRSGPGGWDVPSADESPVAPFCADRLVGTAPSVPVSGASTSPLLLVNYPAGALYGEILHNVLEAVAQRGFSRVSAMEGENRLRMVESVCTREGRPELAAELSHWLPDLLSAPLAALSGRCLGDFSPGDYLAEMTFWFEIMPHDLAILDRHIRASERPDLRRAALEPRTVEGMLTGAIDLVIRHDNRYFVVDYKSNRFEQGPDQYHPEQLWPHILEHRYDLQYVLYTLALHRHLRSRLASAYDYDRCVGGVLYLFVRGIDTQGRGVFQRRVPRVLIDTLDALMGGPA